MNQDKIQHILSDNRLLICVGAGGVGKTSMAATMGVHAALMGRKVLVLTIDPAKRRANSLGLQEFGNEEVQIDLSVLSDNVGELWAMMLDGKQAFHELIDRVAENEETKPFMTTIFIKALPIQLWAIKNICDRKSYTTYYILGSMIW